MKYQKSLLILITLFASFQIRFGQEKPKAILVDEFSKLLCDDLLARIDSLAVQLNNEPNSISFIITFGEKNIFLRSILYEQLLKNSLISLRHDSSRFKFVHGENRENPEVQFWIVPAGADKPEFVEGNWSYDLEVKKAFIIQETDREGIGICPLFPNGELYSKFLLANQNLRGNIVIYVQSLKEFRQTQKKLLNELVKDHAVPPSKIRFFFAKGYGLEFWLVPCSKK